MTLQELEARVRVLEDIEEVKRLMVTYFYHIDNFEWDEVVALFTSKARAEYGILGTYEGKEGIATFFKNVIPMVQLWGAHQGLNPLVTVKGNKAKGRWYLLAPATVQSPEGERAIWIQGRYDNEFVKERGKWKFSLLRFVFNFITPYEDGWVKTKMMGG